MPEDTSLVHETSAKQPAYRRWVCWSNRYLVLHKNVRDQVIGNGTTPGTLCYQYEVRSYPDDQYTTRNEKQKTESPPRVRRKAWKHENTTIKLL